MSTIKIITIFSSILLLFSIILYQKLTKEVAIPKYEDTWWGSLENFNKTNDETIQPFKISWTDKEVEDLKNRLKNTRYLTPPLEKTAWTYGINGTFLKNIIVNYWLNDYNFQSRIDQLNKFSQYRTNIQGLNIHFIHVKPINNVKDKKKVVPLLMLHGWPGSIAEFQKIIPILTSPRDNHDIAFEIVAPSLPGFGFSDAATRPGLGSPQMAVVLKNLMLRLGFNKFYTHGGDWGSIILSQMAAMFPNHVLGLHSAMCLHWSMKIFLKTLLYSLKPNLWLNENYAAHMKPITEELRHKWQHSGYLHIQATFPDTCGVGPSDSPASLAAIVLEKFSLGTCIDNQNKDDGGLFEKFTPDVLIDNLMMYWIPNSMTTAMRIYAESFNSKTNAQQMMWPIKIPSACVQFPDEIIYMPPEFLKDRFINLIQVTKMPQGGHFSSLEEPELMANDIWTFVSTVEQSKVSIDATN